MEDGQVVGRGGSALSVSMEATKPLAAVCQILVPK